jgi:hypothetical protein
VTRSTGTRGTSTTPTTNNGPSTGAMRALLIAELGREVAQWEAAGLFHRAAIRRTASDAGLHPMSVRRLVDLWPEA